jgi:FixJ family two-component response regulator
VPLISVVDDDSSVRQALRRLLGSAGYDVETFGSARAFIDSSPAGRTACLVLDIGLDGMTGFDLLEQLAAHRSAIPIIFMTAHDDARTRRRVRQAGAAAYLVKPFEPVDLLRTLRRIAGSTDQNKAAP